MARELDQRILSFLNPKNGLNAVGLGANIGLLARRAPELGSFLPL
jgi:hypothetical protein